MKKLIKALGLALSVSVICSPVFSSENYYLSEEQRGLYAGFGLGQSMFDPEIIGGTLSVVDDKDLATQFLLGYDLRSWLALELDLQDLGETKFSNEGTVAYKHLGLNSLLYYPRNRGGLDYFFKLGLGYLSIDSSVVNAEEAETGSQFTLGLGGEYLWHNGLSLRGDYSRYDLDAEAVTLSLVKRFGASNYRVQKQRLLEQQNENNGDRPETKPEVTQTSLGPAEVIDEKVVSESGKTAVAYIAGEAHAVEESLTTTSLCNEQVAALNEESLPDFLFRHINFAYNRTDINSDGNEVIQKVATWLNENPSVKIIVSGHADSIGNQSYNLKLSKERSHKVVAQLLKAGVEESRILIKAYGSKRPIISNNNTQLRGVNRRVEFRVY